MKLTQNRTSLGILAASFMIAVNLGIWLFGEKLEVSTQDTFTYISLALCSYFVFIGLKRAREENSGKLSFGNAFLKASAIIIVPVLIYSVFYYFYISYFDTSRPEAFLMESLESAKEKMTPEAYEKYEAQTLERKDVITNPFLLTFTQFFSLLFLGIIISFILSLIMKSKGKVSG